MLRGQIANWEARHSAPTAPASTRAESISSPAGVSEPHAGPRRGAGGGPRRGGSRSGAQWRVLPVARQLQSVGGGSNIQPGARRCHRRGLLLAWSRRGGDGGGPVAGRPAGTDGECRPLVAPVVAGDRARLPAPSWGTRRRLPAWPSLLTAAAPCPAAASSFGSGTSPRENRSSPARWPAAAVSPRSRSRRTAGVRCRYARPGRCSYRTWRTTGSCRSRDDLGWVRAAAFRPDGQAVALRGGRRLHYRTAWEQETRQRQGGSPAVAVWVPQAEVVEDRARGSRLALVEVETGRAAGFLAGGHGSRPGVVYAGRAARVDGQHGSGGTLGGQAWAATSCAGAMSGRRGGSWLRRRRDAACWPGPLRVKRRAPRTQHRLRQARPWRSIASLKKHRARSSSLPPAALAVAASTATRVLSPPRHFRRTAVSC